MVLDGVSKYEDIYKKGLGLSYYNFMLEDYSYFQFSVEMRGKSIQKLRYAFYSNPYELDSDLLGQQIQFMGEDNRFTDL